VFEKVKFLLIPDGGVEVTVLELFCCLLVFSTTIELLDKILFTVPSRETSTSNSSSSSIEMSTKLIPISGSRANSESQ